MAKYNPTIDDYRKAGKELKEISDALVVLDVWIANTFGKKYGLKAVGLTHSKKGSIAQVRSDLEDEMFKDFPDDANFDVFYGETSPESDLKVEV